MANSAANRLAARWDANCCTPLKFISHTAKQLAGHLDGTSSAARKTVAWDDAHLLDIEEISNPCTPIQQNSTEYKSRYKSEPNLCCASEAANLEAGVRESASKHASGSRSLTRKLMKGVSMGNLRFYFATPESTKRLVRTVSSTLRRRSAGDDELPKVGVNAKVEQPIATVESVSLEDLDDETFEDNPDDQLDSDSEPGVDDDEEEEEVADNYKSAYSGAAVHDIGVNAVDGRSSNSNSSDNSTTRYHKQLLLQQSGVHRSMELITSTPSLLLGRRSMSPITKSTQRMPKSMQVSA